MSGTLSLSSSPSSEVLLLLVLLLLILVVVVAAVVVDPPRRLERAKADRRFRFMVRVGWYEILPECRAATEDELLILPFQQQQKEK